MALGSRTTLYTVYAGLYPQRVYNQEGKTDAEEVTRDVL